MPSPRAEILRIALLHLAPLPGEIAHNRDLIERAMLAAAAAGANWIVTPELAVCGYTFVDKAGTDWIAPQPDAWMSSVCRIAAEHRVAIFLSTPERDATTGNLHNAVFVISDAGRLLGRHRKINTLRIGSEAWSIPGAELAPIPVAPFRSVGVLVCSDAYSPSIPVRLHQSGAEFFVSSAAWAPGLHGPNGEWERMTRDTGLPLVVCNRTGSDVSMNFTDAASVVVQNGERLLSLTSATSKIFIVEWDLAAHTLASRQYQEIAV